MMLSREKAYEDTLGQMCRQFSSRDFAMAVSTVYKFGVSSAEAARWLGSHPDKVTAEPQGRVKVAKTWTRRC